MEPVDTVSILHALTSIAVSAERIANALEAQVQAQPAPDLQYHLRDYPGFDWSTIGAEVIKRDKHGAIAVKYCGRIYTRRNPQNKYGPAIWYSRNAGSNGEKTVYDCLIKFDDFEPAADPLNPKTVELLRSLRASSPTATG